MPHRFRILEDETLNLALDRQMNISSGNEEQLWQAVSARDPRRDGEFVFAVSSTGIYCRPSCPSRRPRRDRITFFSLPEAAERAGFRPCLRCRPRDVPAGDPKVEIVRRACQLLEQSDETINLTQLSEQLGVSSFHLQRTFKRIVGISPRQYAEAHRTTKFKGKVREGQSITGAMYDSGYGSSSRLYERATAELGMTPATYSRNGRGAVITFAVAKCDLGELLVAATEKGICAVRLGQFEDELEAALRRVAVECDNEACVGTVENHARIDERCALKAAAVENQCIAGTEREGQRRNQLVNACGTALLQQRLERSEVKPRCRYGGSQERQDERQKANARQG